ncbi:helix-turn-helix domain-containing protein [Micromonospora sp. HM134]|uniref:helix-turn-helix domain-containing protein n=1 Tax=Micromonospora sp. HM134 TaxID=2583243 RepID=UPI00197C0FD7|nr:helix-turn-helix domain-containing protein [Micromonospora sp. HM134]
MTRYRYTPEMLAEAAAQSRSVADVLRVLGVRFSGGSHAHISRQLKRLGIDTSHFTRRTGGGGRPSGRRTPSTQVLRPLPAGSRRVPGARLKAALRDIGVPDECEGCGTGPVWQGRPLTLHVDHLSGDFLDNRPPNLRLLCPNCHSQTPTYAGRHRSGVGARPAGTVPDITAPPPAAYRPPAPAPAPAPVGAERVAEVIRQVEAGALGPSGAARRIGCHRNHVARLRRRLAATGTVAAPPRPRDGPAHQRTVIRYALARPDLGPRKLAAFIRTATGDTCVVSHGTVSNILRRAGLSTVSARRSKL